MPTGGLMRIGQLSGKSGFTIKTLRYYDEIGLVRPSRRNPVSGLRRYSEEAVLLLGLVALAKRAGFTLDETRAILAAARKRATPNHVFSMLDRKIGLIGEQVMHVRGLRERLVAARRYGLRAVRYFADSQGRP